ncbi:MAG: CehA/McbA family metallohydrolase [Rikenellaceae bacterium]
MKTKVITACLALSLAANYATAQMRRSDYSFPNTAEYKVLNCDLHQHTVFSDGTVWPTVRVNEAWEESLDVIVLSEHIEYRRFSDDIKTKDHNRSWELAHEDAKRLGITLIRSCEITRALPAGHLNAIGIKDANAFEKFMSKKNRTDTLNVHAALREAKAQGAFIQWNHPAYPEMHWGDVQKQFINEGLIDGIEVINGECYVSEAFDWCLDHNLTITSNTDVHSTMAQKRASDQSKTMTLLLAKSQSEEDVMEALYAGRSAGLWRDNMYGREQVVSEIVSSAIKINICQAAEANKGFIEIENNSSMPYTVEVVDRSESLKFWCGQTMIFGGNERMALDGSIVGDDELFITLKFHNVFITPTENLVVKIPVSKI